MITKTIGTGGDYATGSDFFDAIRVSPLTDDYKVIYISDVTEPDWANTEIQGAGHTVEFTATSPDITVTLINCYFKTKFNVNTPIRIVWHDLRIEANSIIGGTIGPLLEFRVQTAAKMTIEIYNVVFVENTASSVYRAISIDNSYIPNLQLVVYNCKFYNWSSAIYLAYDQLLTGLYVKRIENCSIYDGTRGIELSGINVSGYTFVNTVCCGCTTDWSLSPSHYTQNTWINCADSDGTLPSHTGRVQNIVPANEFASLNPNSSDYLELKNDAYKELQTDFNPVRGKAPLDVKFIPSVDFSYGSMGAIAYGGTAPTYATTDINGYERPGEDNLYSIGAAEAQFEWRID